MSQLVEFYKSHQKGIGRFLLFVVTVITSIVVGFLILGILTVSSMDVIEGFIQETITTSHPMIDGVEMNCNQLSEGLEQSTTIKQDVQFMKYLKLNNCN